MRELGCLGTLDPVAMFTFAAAMVAPPRLANLILAVVDLVPGGLRGLWGVGVPVLGWARTEFVGARRSGNVVAL